MRLLRRLCLTLALPVLTLMLALTSVPVLTGVAAADGCYICRSGSSCGQQCRYSGKDSWKKRQKCIKAGCKIGGTASCSTAANVKVCTGAWPLDLTPKHAALPQSYPASQ
jgi:hypothetical protein